jgi:outer membrane protein assembly factor BamB/class 3 adenylate cyclase
LGTSVKNEPELTEVFAERRVEGPANGVDPSASRTFLIADIRGYTSYTNDHGDEAAAALARRFADIARRTVEAREGRVLELRGDEALAIFTSARQAIRAAVALQAAVAEAGLPRGIGIGLDTGEAVPVDEGYRGTALNVAARLCAQARAGQVLATETVVHLAARIEDVRYAEPRAVRLKGFDGPVRIVDVVAATDAAGVEGRRLGAIRMRRSVAVLGGLALVAVAVIAIVGAPMLGGGGAGPRAGASPSSNAVAGGSPGASTSGSGGVPVSPPASPGTAIADVAQFKGDLARTDQMPGPEPEGQPVVRWTYRAKSDMNTPMAIVDGTLYAGRVDGTLDAIDVATGQERWSLELGPSLSAAPAVANGTLYVTSTDGILHAIDIASHQERWHVGGLSATAVPAVVGDGVYAGFAGGQYAALAAADGKERWHVDITGGGERAAISGGTAYVAGEGTQTLYAVSLDSASIRWTYEATGTRIITPAVSEGTVYLVTVAAAGGGSNLVALDAASGQPRWSFGPPDRGSLATLAVGTNLVYTSGDALEGTNLFAIDKATGHQRWSVVVPDGSAIHPAIASTHVYVAAGAVLHQLDAASGIDRWSIRLGGSAVGTPVITGGLVFVASVAGSGPPGVSAFGFDPTASPAPPVFPATWVADLTAHDAKPTLYLNVVTDAKGNVYAADRVGNRVVIWDAAGRPTIWGHRGNGPGAFDFREVTAGDQSQSVAIAADGRIAVGDGGNHRVQVFDAKRRFTRSIGREGNQDGEFINPCCVAFDRQGLLYVADPGRGDIQVFDRSGGFVRVIGGEGSGNGQFSRLAVPFIDPATGNVWVPDFGNRRIQVMSPEGAYLATYGAGQSGVRIAQPNGVVVDSAGRMFIVDTDNVVYMLDAQGGLITTLGPDIPGHGNVQPAYLWLSGDGKLYLADSTPSNARIVVLQLKPPLWPPPK